MSEQQTPSEAQPTAPEPPDQPPPASDEPDLSKLDEHTRRYVERLTGEATTRRHAQRAAEQQLEQLRRRHESEQERAVREAEERGGQRIREQLEAEHAQVVSGYEEQLGTLAITAKAAGQFNDPVDAVAQLRQSGALASLLAEKDPGRRERAIDAALSKLLEAKPYLGAQRERAPLVTQGARSQAPDGRPRERSWLRP